MTNPKSEISQEGGTSRQVLLCSPLEDSHSELSVWAEQTSYRNSANASYSLPLLHYGWIIYHLRREYRSQCSLLNSHSRLIPTFPRNEVGGKSLIAWEHQGALRLTKRGLMAGLPDCCDALITQLWEEPSPGPDAR